MAKTKIQDWKARKRHEGVTLPSGMEVTIEVPNLFEMLRGGSVPNNLVKMASKAQATPGGADGLSVEQVKESTDFLRWLVSITVKEPEITEEDVPDIPMEDLDMILSFAMRDDDVDAVGHQLSGMETSEKWRKFRYGRFTD